MTDDPKVNGADCTLAGLEKDVWEVNGSAD